MKSREKKSEVFKESNASAIWYLQIWDTVSQYNPDASSGSLIPGVVEKVPFAKNTLEFAGQHILPYVAPLAILAPSSNTLKTIENYQAAENKNFEKTLDVAFSITTTLAAVAWMVLLFTPLAPFAPYVLAAALGLGVLVGAANTCKHLYRAYKHHRKGETEKRNEHLWHIPRQLLTTAISLLGLAFNLPQLNQVVNAVSIFGIPAAKFLFYGLASLVTAGIVPSMLRKSFTLNKETYHFLRQPIKSLGKAGASLRNTLYDGLKFIYQNPGQSVLLTLPVLVKTSINALTALTTTALRFASLFMMPLHFAYIGGKMAIANVKKHFNNTRQVAIANHDEPERKTLRSSKAISTKTIMDGIRDHDKVMERARIKPLAEAEHSQLKAEVNNEISHLEFQLKKAGTSKSQKHELIAKLVYTSRIQSKLGETLKDYDKKTSLETIKKTTKTFYSQNTFLDFWSERSKPEILEHKMHKLDKKMQILKPEDLLPPRFQRATSSPLP